MEVERERTRQVARIGLASHFIPRYAEPQIPLRVTATMVLLYLAWTSLRTRRFSRSGPPQLPERER